MTMPSEVLDHVLRSITPASGAQRANAASRANAKTAPRANLGVVQTLAEVLAGARHSPHPEVAAKHLVVCAADHGVGLPGIDFGDSSPTIAAVREITAGTAAVNSAVRAVHANVVVVDCGIRGGEAIDLGPGALSVRVVDGTKSITETAAMTPLDALVSVQTGIALLFSLADQGLDVLGVGQIGMGVEPAASAMIATLSDLSVSEVASQDRDAVAKALDVNEPPTSQPLEVLAAFGGPDLGVLCGILLGAASINVPVILDDHATSAAALLAAAFCSDIRGYLVAAQAGRCRSHQRALSDLGLSPLFDLGLAHGEGTGAALAFPFVDVAAQLLTR